MGGIIICSETLKDYSRLGCQLPLRSAMEGLKVRLAPEGDYGCWIIMGKVADLPSELKCQK